MAQLYWYQLILVIALLPIAPVRAQTPTTPPDLIVTLHDQAGMPLSGIIVMVREKDLGSSLLDLLKALHDWGREHLDEVHAHRGAHEAEHPTA